MEEEQIMILLDGLDDNEDDQDLLEQLVAEPEWGPKSSLDYGYQPAPIPSQDIEETETSELKTSNRSTSTCWGSQKLQYVNVFVQKRVVKKLLLMFKNRVQPVK